MVDDTNDLAEKERSLPEGAISDPYEGEAEWDTQRNACPRLAKSVYDFVRKVSKTMCMELRHRTNRRGSDYSLSPSDLAFLISEKLRMRVTVRDVCASTYLFEQDRAKPRYELKLRPATSADKTRFPQHLVGMNQAGKELVCTRIRAIQGHSTKVNVAALERKKIKLGEPDFPSIIAHATDHEKLSSIIEQGLLPGGIGQKKGRELLHADPPRARCAGAALDAKQSVDAGNAHRYRHYHLLRHEGDIGQRRYTAPEPSRRCAHKQ